MATPPLLTLSDMGVNLGDRWLLRHVDMSIHAGDRLTLVGRNGAGKSTLMKLITGTADADEGGLRQKQRLLICLKCPLSKG